MLSVNISCSNFEGGEGRRGGGSDRGRQFCWPGTEITHGGGCAARDRKRQRAYLAVCLLGGELLRVIRVGAEGASSTSSCVLAFLSRGRGETLGAPMNADCGCVDEVLLSAEGSCEVASRAKNAESVPSGWACQCAS